MTNGSSAVQVEVEVQETRLDRAHRLLEEGSVYKAHGYEDWCWIVTNGGGIAYVIDGDRMACNCPDMVQRLGDPVLRQCKHLLAVRLAKGERVEYPKPTRKLRLQDLYEGVA